MKHFKIVGSLTTREFDIEDYEMIQWKVIKIIDYEHNVQNPMDYPAQNEVVTNND